MIYELSQLRENAAARAGPLVAGACEVLRAWNTGGPQTAPLRHAGTVLELLAGSGPTYRRLRFGLADDATAAGEHCGYYAKLRSVMDDAPAP